MHCLPDRSMIMQQPLFFASIIYTIITYTVLQSRPESDMIKIDIPLEPGMAFRTDGQGVVFLQWNV